MRPGSLKHFCDWASRLILDTGEPWKLEPWQRSIVSDILKGTPTTWVVVPEGNGKTTLMAGLALYGLDTEGAGTLSPQVVVAASTSKQAAWLYGQAESFVRNTEDMAQRLRCLGGFKRIERAKDLPFGRLEVFAGDDSAADGAIFTLAIVDELHRHRDLKLYRIWRGKLSKRGGQLVAISTAGEPNSEFEELRAKMLAEATSVKRSGLRGVRIRAEWKNVTLHDWGIRRPEDADDIKVVAAANPLKRLTEKALREKREEPDMTDEHWLRFTCNWPTRVEGSAITATDWDALRETDLSFPTGSYTIGGLDLGWQIDTTAMVILVWESENRRLLLGTRILEPPVDEADIVSGLVYLQREFNPVGWAYDPNAGGQQMAQLLEKGMHPGAQGVDFTFFPHSQDNAPIALASTRFDEALRTGRIRHDGHQGLRHHVLGAVKKSLGGEKWRYDRPLEAKGRMRSKYPIDALTASLLAHNIAVGEKQEKPKPGRIIVY